MKSQQIIRRAGLARLGVVISFAMLACAAALPAGAQTKSLKVGVVDIDQIMQRSASFQSAARRIESELTPLREKYNNKMGERDSLRQSIRARRSVLKPEEVAQQEEKYFAIVDEVNDINYTIEKESGRLQREILEPVMKRLKGIIEEIAKRDGYDLVLYANQLFYFSEQVDLTSVILQSLDRGASALPEPAAAPSSESSSSKAKSSKKGK